jgi:shikimate kinase
MSATVIKMKTSASKAGATASSSSEPAPQIKVFLVGMMGSGKSYWAQKLKKKLSVAAYDLDALVEMMEEKSTAEIFEEDGEEYFRKAEAKMLRLFSEKKQFILSVGGGTPCHHDNMKWMNKHGVTIWIYEPVETLCQRLMKEKATRPLIKDMDDNQLNEFLTNLLGERTEFYNQSAHKLCGEDISESAIAKLLKEHA